MKLMKIPTVLILAFVSFYSMGCTSLKPVSHSFANVGIPAAAIHFEGGLVSDRYKTSGEGVYFVDFNGTKLPRPANGTRETIFFPAGEPLKFTVRAYHYTDIMPMFLIGSFCMETIILAPIGIGFYGLALLVDLPIGIALNFDKEVVFECPPMEAGEDYTLKVRRKSKGVNRALVLTHVDTYMAVYEQEF